MFWLLCFVLFSSRDAWRGVTAARRGERWHRRLTAPHPCPPAEGSPRVPRPRAEPPEPPRGRESGVPGSAGPAEPRRRQCRSRGALVGVRSSRGGTLRSLPPTRRVAPAVPVLSARVCWEPVQGRVAAGPPAPLPTADPRTPRARRGAVPRQRGLKRSRFSVAVKKKKNK